MKERPYELDPRITRAVFRAIDDVNQMLPQEYWLEKSYETPILGATALLDSMGFVNLIAAVEDRIAEEYGVQVSLMNDSSAQNRPFETIGSIVNHVSSLIDMHSESDGR